MKKPALAVLIIAILYATPFVANAQEVPSDEAATKWTAQSLPPLLTFEVENFLTKKQENRKYFTQHGYDTFYDALERARLLEMMTQYKQSAEMKLICPPTLVGSHVDSSIKTWQFKVPVTMAYKGESQSRTDTMSVTVAVKQSSDAMNAEGLGIDQYIAISLDPLDVPSSCDDKPVQAPSP